MLSKTSKQWVLMITVVATLTSCNNYYTQTSVQNRDDNQSNLNISAENIIQDSRFSMIGYNDIKLGDRYDSKLFTQQTDKEVSEIYGCKNEESLIYENIGVMVQK